MQPGDPAGTRRLASARAGRDEFIQGYRLIGHLGDGGMASVWRAWGLDGRAVAIKVLDEKLARHPRFRQRFFAEAELQSKLRHPHVVRVEQILLDPLALVLELVEGGTLSAELRRGPPTLERVREVMAGITAGVGAAHQVGIIHRDLKPGNVLLGPDRQPKVADFGLAKIAGLDGLTRSGQVMGTLKYMAPEQFKGAKHVDARADVYSLGVILYQMLAGRVPFSGTDFELGQAHVHDGPPDPRQFAPEIPEVLVEVLEATLAKDPDRRPADADALGARIEAAFRVMDGYTAPMPLVSLDILESAPAAEPGGVEPPAMEPAMEPGAMDLGAMDPGAMDPGAPSVGVPVSADASSEAAPPSLDAPPGGRSGWKWALGTFVGVSLVAGGFFALRPSSAPPAAEVVGDVSAAPEEVAVGAAPSLEEAIAPASVAPASVAPGSVAPASVAPASVAPASVAPGSVAPASVAPGSVAPGSVAPGSVAPASVAPASVAPASVAPVSVAPASVAPASVAPASVAPGLAPIDQVAVGSGLPPQALEALRSQLVLRDAPPTELPASSNVAVPADNRYHTAMQEALTLISRDAYGDALPLLFEAVRLEPTAALPHKALCAVLSELNRPAEALAHCRAWRSLAPDLESQDQADDKVVELEDQLAP